MGEDKILYHYCSMQAFYGIITSRSLWLSDAFKTNDEQELKYVFEVTNQQPGKPLSKQELLDVINLFIKDCKEIYYPHITCFSQDNDLLSQWKAYANDGQGVCIGFNKKFFISRNYRLEEVIYDCDTQIKILNKTLYKIKDSMTESFFVDLLKMKAAIGEKKAREAIDISSKTLLPLIRTISEIFLECGFKVKHPSFHQEKEIRIIKSHNNEPSSLKYRIMNDDIVSYIPILLYDETVNNLPIKEIILGPNNKSSEYDIRNFVYKHFPGINVNVFRSASTYRRF